MVKVLLVDDETSFSSTLGERLLLRGFEVFMAPDGEQAVAMMASKKPDVVLMDLSLPDIDGLEVMERLKNIDTNVEVIILSGYGADRREEAEKKGAFSYVMKPVKLKDLIDVIKAAFTQRSEKS